MKKVGFKKGLFSNTLPQGNGKVDPWKYEEKVVWRCVYLFQDMNKLLIT
jgi:hypothetical protein